MCNNCHHWFVFRNFKNKYYRLRKWFYLWVKEGYSVRQLGAISGHGKKKIKAIIHYWMKQNIPKLYMDLSSCHYLIFDGTYFKRENCLVLLINHLTNEIITGSYLKRENYHSTFEIFLNLRKQGLHPKAITIDGNTTAIRAVREIWPESTIQRCIIHIQRQGLSWLRRNPKTKAAIELRKLLLFLTKVESKKDKINFIRNFNLWERKFGNWVRSLPSNDKVFSDLQRTRSLIIHSLPDMFHFLDDSSIPSSTNKLEGIFSKVKENFQLHKGLRKDNRSKYFQWYIYFKNS